MLEGLNQLASAAQGEDQESLALPRGGGGLPPGTANNIAPGSSRASPDVDDFRDEPSHSPTSSRGAGLQQGRARSNRGRKSAIAAVPHDSYAQRHQAAEARRRNRINGRIEALRKLVPNDPRANTATFLEDVIKYILSLQDSNEKLEAVLQAFSQQHQQQQQQQPQQSSQQAQALQAQLPQLLHKPQPEPKEQHQHQQPEPQHSSHSIQTRQNSDSSPQLLPPSHLNGMQLPATGSSAASCLPPPLQLPACVPLEAQLQGAQALMLLQQQQQHQQTHAQQLQQLQLQLQGVNQQHAHQALLHQHHQQQQQQQHLAGAISAELLNSSNPVLTHNGNLTPSFPPTLAHSLLSLPPAQLPHQQHQLLHLPPQLAPPPATLTSLGQLQLASTLLPHSTTLPQQLAGLGAGGAGAIIGGSSTLAATTPGLLGSQQGGPSTVPTLAPSASSIPSTPALGGEHHAVLLAPQDLPASAQ